jgi:hypothetical protein
VEWLDAARWQVKEASLKQAVRLINAKRGSGRMVSDSTDTRQLVEEVNARLAGMEVEVGN